MQAEALLALWNDVDPATDAEYNDWHANEHVPERLTVPGMLWGRRYAKADGIGMPRYLTLYGLRDAAVLDSEPYLKLLREPTPMSRRMRPELLNLSRWVCALSEQAETEAARLLAVWAFDSSAGAARTVRGIGGSLGTTMLGHLLAQRLPQARALPWTQAGQTRSIEGQALLFVGLAAPAAGAVGLQGAMTYERLRCG